MPGEELQTLRCFVAMPMREEFVPVREAVLEGAKKAGFKAVSFDKNAESFPRTMSEWVIGELSQVDCLVADVTDANANVLYELGMARAMGKSLIIIANESSKSLPSYLTDFYVISYGKTLLGLEKLSAAISRSLLEYRHSPRRSMFQATGPLATPFFIDWERIGEREAENLFRELLVQMGFQEVEWGKFSPEIDLIAEFPRKDPDGFEYRELWLISMGMNAPAEELLMMASEDPYYFFRRIIKYSERFEKYYRQKKDIPMTFLLIDYRRASRSKEMERLQRMSERRFMGKEPLANFRFRIWDQPYLTSLIQRFPQLGYKYFSDEGRIRSQTRKSYEDLYMENSELSERVVRSNVELEAEKNRRITAERDAVWKDITFSAAHKIGNPIFAIETNLDPLVKRIRENKTAEVNEVITDIRSSVEKAKSIIEQFKSLEKAQDIQKTVTLLRPLIEDACRLLTNQGTACDVECPIDLSIPADPGKLAECFDELAANAAHWVDKPEKKMIFKVTPKAPKPLPDFIDSSKEYVLINVRDNGRGIAVENKKRVFDAFFTTYQHGTGLGLALVRRIIDGHGGAIIETGTPGQGAVFEIYLPLGEKKPARKPAKEAPAKKIKER